MTLVTKLVVEQEVVKVATEIDGCQPAGLAQPSAVKPQVVEHCDVG